MSPAEWFTAELAALLAACHLPTAVATPLRLTTGDLDITLTRHAAALDIDLAGWRQRFDLCDHDDGRDAAALALDLLGAALFGALRIVVDSYRGRPSRFTLQLRHPTGWHPGLTQGARPWNPLTRRTTAIHSGALPRPPRYAPIAVTSLPWAPWAGQAGFFGRPADPLPAELPVDGELDLHNFPPREIKRLVLAYLEVCRARGITEVRIVHGKGIGNLRRTVHALLDRHPHVTAYRLGGHGGGGWGATIVDLSAPETPHAS